MRMSLAQFMNFSKFLIPTRICTRNSDTRLLFIILPTVTQKLVNLIVLGPLEIIFYLYSLRNQQKERHENHTCCGVSESFASDSCTEDTYPRDIFI